MGKSAQPALALGGPRPARQILQAAVALQLQAKGLEVVTPAASGVQMLESYGYPPPQAA